MGRIIRFIAIFGIGFVAGAAFWYLASPLWIDRVVSEPLAGNMLVPARSGQFQDADSAHKGSGVATIFTSEDGQGAILRFTEFEVTNGPDLEVWLSAHPGPTSSSDVNGNEWLSLGQLKGNIGDQNYAIPEGTDLNKFKSVVIWCEQFGVLFSPASLDG